MVLPAAFRADPAVFCVLLAFRAGPAAVFCVLLAFLAEPTAVFCLVLLAFLAEPTAVFCLTLLAFLADPAAGFCVVPLAFLADPAAFWAFGETAISVLLPAAAARRGLACPAVSGKVSELLPGCLQRTLCLVLGAALLHVPDKLR